MFNTCGACLLGSRAPESKNRVNTSHERDGVRALFYAATAAPAEKRRAGLYLRSPATKVNQCKWEKQTKQNPEIMRIKCNSTSTLSNVTSNKKKNTTAITLPLECFYRATELERRQRGSYLFDVSDEVVQRVGRSVSLWTDAHTRSHVKVKLISLENSYEKLHKDRSYEI